MNSEVIKNEILYTNLVSLGNFYALAGRIDIGAVLQQVEEFHKDWHPYNSFKLGIGREGLSLTSLDGGLGGEELTSLLEYNRIHGTRFTEGDFNKPTKAMEKITAISEGGIKPFIPYLGRTHLIRFEEGAYFPPHRDSQSLGADNFRIISLLHNCEPVNFHFIYDEQKITLTPGKLYFMNTKITHSLMSYFDDAMIFVANVILSQESAECVIKNLECQ